MAPVVIKGETVQQPDTLIPGISPAKADDETTVVEGTIIEPGDPRT